MFHVVLAPLLTWSLHPAELYCQDTPGAKLSTRFQAACDFVPPGHLLYLERRKVEGEGGGSCRGSGPKGQGRKGQERYASR